ncbi:MAG: hypothetical protein WC889_09485, partial [Myxococcota bacterium]
MRTTVAFACVVAAISLFYGCDEADSKFKQAQRDEQYNFVDGALQNYMAILKKFGSSEAADKSKDRVFEILKIKTKNFTSIDPKSKEIIDYFLATFPDSKLGAQARQLLEV